METSLHRQLKEMYADENAQTEVPLAGYRIDAVRRGLLIEIQHGPLSAIRDKIRDLLKKHRVLVVKPIVAEKMLVKQDAKSGNVVSRRKSPKRGNLLDVFDELVYFTRVFPHRRLALEVALVTVEEWRYPGHGRRRRHRDNDHQIEDQRLVDQPELGIEDQVPVVGLLGPDEHVGGAECLDLAGDHVVAESDDLERVAPPPGIARSAYDAVVLRPLGFLQVVVGAVVLVPSYPVALLVDGDEDVWRACIADPVERTFRRPLGRL